MRISSGLVLVLGAIARESLATIHAVEGRIDLPKSLGIPADIDRSALLNDVRISILSEGKEVGRSVPDVNGTFSVQFSSPGSDTSLLVFLSHPWLRFSPVSITAGSDGQFTAYKYDPIRTGSPPTEFPLRITPTAFQSPYTPEEEFNAFHIFKNPMVIMGLVMLALVWLMPKLQGTVSPDEMRDMRKDLENDDGIAAKFLKNMIPSESAAGGSGMNLPSLTAGNGEGKKTK